MIPHRSSLRSLSSKCTMQSHVTIKSTNGHRSGAKHFEYLFYTWLLLTSFHPGRWTTEDERNGRHAMNNSSDFCFPRQDWRIRFQWLILSTHVAYLQPPIRCLSNLYPCCTRGVRRQMSNIYKFSACYEIFWSSCVCLRSCLQRPQLSKTHVNVWLVYAFVTHGTV